MKTLLVPQKSRYQMLGKSFTRVIGDQLFLNTSIKNHSTLPLHPKENFHLRVSIQNDAFNFYSFYSTNLNLDISAATGIAIPDIIDTLKESDLIVNDGRYSLVLIYYFHFHVWYLSLTVDFDIDAIKQHWDEAHMKTSRIWLDASKLKVND